MRDGAPHPGTAARPGRRSRRAGPSPRPRASHPPAKKVGPPRLDAFSDDPLPFAELAEGFRVTRLQVAARSCLPAWMQGKQPTRRIPAL